MLPSHCKTPSDIGVLFVELTTVRPLLGRYHLSTNIERAGTLLTLFII